MIAEDESLGFEHDRQALLRTEFRIFLLCQFGLELLVDCR
jgi:hypothetical protein